MADSPMPISPVGPYVPTPQPGDIQPNAAYVGPTTPQAYPSADDRILPPLQVDQSELDATQRRMQALRDQGVTGSDPVQSTNFFHKALEIFDFVIRLFPGIGQIYSLFSAIVQVGRLAYALLSGQNREQIDWTKELARLAGNLMGVAFPFAGALMHGMLNYWFDAMSETRQGVQIAGGLNYMLPEEYGFGPYRRGVVRDTLDGARSLVSGVFTPTQQPYVDPYSNAALVTQPGITPSGVPQGPVPQQDQGPVFAPAARRAARA